MANVTKLTPQTQKADVTVQDTTGDDTFEDYIDIQAKDKQPFAIPQGASPLPKALIQLFAHDSAGDELPANARVRLVHTDINDEDTTVIYEFDYADFKNADQDNDEEQQIIQDVKANATVNKRPVRLVEPLEHFKIQVKSGTAISAADTPRQFGLIAFTV